MAIWCGSLPFVLSCLGAGSVIHVDDSASGSGTGASWGNAFVHLQDALSAAVAGDQVWVATGTYRPDSGVGQSLLDPNASFAIPDGVAVYGGFAGTETSLAARAGLFDQTVLDGDLLGDDQAGFVGYDDNSAHVVTLYAVGPTTRLDGFTVRGGHARPGYGGWGGGVLVSSGGAPTIAHCTLRENQSFVPPFGGEVRGGGLFAEGADLVLADCTITGNRAVSSIGGGHSIAAGGGAAVAGGSLHALRTTFASNFVTGDFYGSGYGGGLATMGAVVVVEDGGFHGNEATGGLVPDTKGDARGGGLYVDEGSLVVRGASFTDNRVESHADPSYGGGLYAREVDPVIRNCRFEDNLSTAGGVFVDTLGGGLSCFSKNLWIESCSFLGNRAVSFAYDSWAWGGAVYQSGGSATIVSSQFSGNRAYRDTGSGYAFGGAIVSAGSTAMDVIDSTFHGNKAGTPSFGQGGAIHATSVQVRVTNCIFWSNSDTAGSGESSQIWSNPSPVIEHSCVMGWSGALGGSGNIGSDPLFVAPAGADAIVGTFDDDLRLRSGSPCIDAGDTGSLPADAFDGDGDGVTSEPSPFDSAQRPRRVDDHAAPDSGIGLAPQVDMGAHESPGFHDANANFIQDDLEHCQLDLGYRGPGSTTLSVCGDALITAGSAATLLVTGAPPVTRLVLVLGATVAPTPLLTGILVPTPPSVVISALTTDATGQASAVLRGGAGPQFTIAAQVLVVNGALLEFSNAVLGVSG